MICTFLSRSFCSLVLSLACFVSVAGFAAELETAVYLPKQYNTDVQWPVVILLHGSGATGDMQDLHLGIGERVSKKGIILVVPEARAAAVSGARMNSSTALIQLIAQIARDYSVDRQRVYLIGHSMGGYQSLQFACDHGDLIAGMVISAASGVCSNGVAPVKMLIATGDADVSDQAIDSTLEGWRLNNNCNTSAVVTPGLDLHWEIAGAETTKSRWNDCAAGASIVSLRSHNGRHVPIFKGEFADQALDFLLGAGEAFGVIRTGCVPEGDDRNRFVTSELQRTTVQTALTVNEYADPRCTDLRATVVYTGPGGQGNGQPVFGIKFEQVTLTPRSADIVTALNGNGTLRPLCNQNWQQNLPVTVAGRNSAGRQSCVTTTGNISDSASFAKRLVLSYVFSPPLP